MSVYAQEPRLIAVQTPLGPDALLLRGFVYQEGMSQLFTIDLDMLSERAEIPPEEIVGKSVTVTLRLWDGDVRPFHGFVSQFASGMVEQRGLRAYRARLVPWLWFLTRTADCRIFQDLSPVKIVETVLAEAGFDFELRLARQYPVRTFCVQYRETDFNFVCRLLEQEGIFFYFRHEEGRHVMVLADSADGYQTSGTREVRYAEEGATGEVVQRWEHRTSFTSGRWSLKDYNFQAPGQRLESATSTVVDLSDIARYELFDYPGEFEDETQGDGYVRTRMEETESSHEEIEASGPVRGLSLGGVFALKAPGIEYDHGARFVVSGQRISATDDGYVAGAGGGVHSFTSVTCLPESVVFRPARTTPKPVIGGLQTAVVVGPVGEEIHTDEHGRVKLQFHWDRYGRRDQDSSCWIRVAQVWAGSRWGALQIPRVGQEVVVAFLEGDPDCPLVIGSVYNAAQRPPFDLPAQKTRSGIRSRTSKGGGDQSFNELRFEDRAGEEEVYFHAERDFSRVVERDDALVVGQDQTRTIKRHRAITVEEGNDKLDVKLGKQETEALVSIEDRVGENSIKIEQSGITIKGLMVKIEAQSITIVKGAAIVQVQGGIVTVN